MDIGVDLDKANAVYSDLDEVGQVVMTSRVSNTLDGWKEFYKAHPLEPDPAVSSKEKGIRVKGSISEVRDRFS